MTAAGGVFTIPPGVPFVDALAAGLLDRHGSTPEDLAAVTVLLPTRRACRALREAFLRHGDGRPMLLPRMMPLGDLDEEELALGSFAEEDVGGLDLPPAIGGLRRQLLLARLVMGFEGRAFDGGRATPEQAVRLAGELARLLDQVQTERLDFGRLRELVPEAAPKLSAHWQKVLEFLDIVVSAWPDVLAGEGAVDPSDRRNRMLAAQAALWRAHPPEHPVVAAGSTGTIPATAELLAVVAGLPQGALVLPGLDRAMDDEDWAQLDATHPQYGLARLLARLDVARAGVPDWPAPGVDGVSPARAALINEAMRAAATTHRWAEAPSPPPEALAGVRRLDCPGPREEAAAIALMMREVLETPGRRAALVTADRGLARRVAAELRRFDVEVDDSAGTPLDQTTPGAFLRLAAEVATGDAPPVALLALLKHPLAGGGMALGPFRRLVRRIEVLALRGPRPAAGIAGLREAVHGAAVERGQDAAPLDALLARLGDAMRPFGRLLAGSEAAVPDLVAAHGAFAEALAATDAEAGSDRLWAGEAGEAAAGLVADLMQAAADFPPIRGADYPALLRACMGGRVVRPRWGKHPRLAIWGLLEARLQQADRLILGGLNEGGWPPEVQPGPWMSRPMQREFGLPLPERRIGLSAHDFAQAFCAPEVVLTRSTRVDGTPTLPSRWLARLDNLLAGRETAVPEAAGYLDWATRRDTPAAVEPRPAPRPTPPVEARPRRLSVTRIETWIRDPYALYAEQVLGLRPLDPLDADPGAADRGSIIHAALDDFLRAYPDDLPLDAEDRLIDIGRAVFDPLRAWPGVRAFWWPRFRRIAAWFVDWERDRRARGRRTLATERTGEMAVAAGGVDFTLRAQADRLDRLPEGGWAVVDYKTGVPPSWPQVKTGLAPQLSLEGAMLAAGAFPGLPADAAAELVYLRLSGGRVAGEEKVLAEDVPDLCQQALDGLRRRIAAYANPDTPYLSRPRPMFLGRFSDYDHLARVAEWSAGVEEAE